MRIKFPIGRNLLPKGTDNGVLSAYQDNKPHGSNIVD